MAIPATPKKVMKRIARQANRTLFAALISAARRHGGGARALVDGDGRELTYTEVVRAAFALGRAIARRTKPGEHVGIMLPTVVGAMVAFFAVLSRGRVPAMINFTAGPRNIKSAIRAAELKQILTAHLFIEIAGLEVLEDALKDAAELVYLEDVRENLTTLDKLSALIGSFLPSLVRAHPKPSSPGVILFTSGTEGDPKGVVLSHSNILANVAQINEHIETLPTDIFFNPLPTFHSYGLTAGTLYPILSGMPAVLHPSPLQVKEIPLRIEQVQATVLFATDTFLSQYARSSKGTELSSLRFAVCGAERVRDETRSMVKKRFDLDVLEGYGVTEGSPVLAANQTDDIRSGTVGKMLPAIEVKLEPVEGLPDAGRLFVRGPNVMSGYLSVNRPGEIIPLEDDWHDTGDVVSIDANGYVTIRDRLKRFAKIAGEMISLTVVENCASAIWPDYMHAAIAVADSRKGEQIVLLTENPAADRKRLSTWATSHGVPQLAVPKIILHTEAVPVLGTGKVDYVGVRKQVEEQMKNGVPDQPEPPTSVPNPELPKQPLPPADDPATDGDHATD